MQVHSPSPSHIRGSLTDNRSVYILVVPADNADAQNPGAASVRNIVNDAADSGEPVHFQNPAGGSSTAYWGVFHVEAAAEAHAGDSADAPASAGEETVTSSAPGTAPRIVRAHRVSAENLPAYVREVESRADARKSARVRWVWADTRVLGPLLLEAQVRVHLCHDLRLVQRILSAAATHPGGHVRYSPVLELMHEPHHEPPRGYLPPARQVSGQQALFDDLSFSAAQQSSADSASPAVRSDDASSPASRTPLIAATFGEFAAQLHAIAAAAHPDRLSLLAHAESAGALVAAEIGHWGIPFDAQEHHKNLEQLLGPRPGEGEHPAKMVELAEHIRRVLFAPQLNPDSPQDLLRALQRAGAQVESTRSWKLKAWAQQNPARAQERHAMIDPVLRYKKLYRIWTANGWNWADTWVHQGRFRPHLEVGGAATGRWGASGGGALQLPAEIRSAIIAPQYQVFTVADGSQIEPRILAALSRDEALAAAGRGVAGHSTDLYEGIAELSRSHGLALTERAQAKVGLLAIMYGGRSGEVGALLPHIAQLFPRAMEFTERAARIGEQGGQVTTFLGRTSPAPSDAWRRTVADRSTGAAEARAVSASRAWGRMTRNFVVQGTAAEWALCWMGRVRSRLLSETVFGSPMRTKIVYFLHDELVLCGPSVEAKRVEAIVRESAQQAAQLLFGGVPVDFPVSVTVTRNYAEAK